MMVKMIIEAQTVSIPELLDEIEDLKTELRNAQAVIDRLHLYVRQTTGRGVQ